MAASSSLERPSLLVVDDDETFRERLARALRDRGFEVHVASDFSSGLRAAAADPPEMAVVDLKMPGRSGLDLVRELRAIDAGTRIVVLTGYGSIATAVEAIKLGARHYLTKPADADEILTALGAHADEEVSPGPTVHAPVTSTIPGTPSLARAEWEHIQRVLADCAGNVSEAARRLSIHRRSLQRKLARNPPGA
jgi:two-component system response regulator RegA